MGFVEQSFKKGQGVKFTDAGRVTHRGVVVGRKKKRGYPCAIVETLDGTRFTVPLALLSESEPAPMPKALEGLKFGPLRQHGTGREAPRWSRTWKFKEHKGSVNEDGCGGDLRWESKSPEGSRVVCDAIKEAVEAETLGVEFHCIDAIIIEWATFDRLCGQTFREAIDAFEDEVRALIRR
jgi:hypothetical protein